MEVIGILKVKEETSQVSEKFKKSEFVIELVQDSCPMLDQFNLDSKLRVEFDLRGRKWTNPDGVDKYFNSLQAWKIETLTTDPDVLPF